MKRKLLNLDEVEELRDDAEWGSFVDSERVLDLCFTLRVLRDTNLVVFQELAKNE